MSNLRSAALTEVFHCLPQIRPRPRPSLYFYIQYLLFDFIWPDMLTADLNEMQMVNKSKDISNMARILTCKKEQLCG